MLEPEKWQRSMESVRCERWYNAYSDVNKDLTVDNLNYDWINEFKTK